MYMFIWKDKRDKEKFLHLEAVETCMQSSLHFLCVRGFYIRKEGWTPDEKSPEVVYEGIAPHILSKLRKSGIIFLSGIIRHIRM